jgi:DNA-binding SARP family transcriptional activator
VAARNEHAHAEEPYELRALLARVDELRRAGKTREAVVVLEGAVTEYVAFAGPRTPVSLSLRNALASLWVEDTCDPSRVEAATALVAECEAVLGADDPRTISARDHLACLLAMAGEHDRALDLHRRTVRDAARVLGTQAAATRHIRANLAATLLSMGRPGDATKELEVLLAGSDPASDLDHERLCQSLRIRRLLARCHLAQGRTDEARALLQQLVPDAARVLGRDAPLTVEVSGLLARLSTFRGPVVTARGDVPRRWVFVADARASLTERFAAPKARSRRRFSADVPPGATSSSCDDEPCTDVAPTEVADAVESTGPVVETVHVRTDGASQPDLFDPDPVDEPRVEVRVMGPFAVVGWSDPGARATQLAEILAYLVFHRDRPVRGPALRLALRPEVDDEITEETLHTYVSMLRHAVGRDLFPPATREGYRLADGVTSDWARFAALSGPDASPGDLERALGLVRGRPFSGVPEGSFRWVDAELLVSVIDAAVADVARRAFSAFRDAGDIERASWSVRQGLCCSPYDVSLWQLHLSLAEVRGPAALARARREAVAALGEPVPTQN